MQSRYYDPTTCRFINADTLASTGQGVLGYNMYVYCLNNPMVYTDLNGHEPTYALDTNGDGEEDCFVYVYSYSKRVSRRGFTQTINVSGKVYIFKGMSPSDFENMEHPEGFNRNTDLLVLDETSGSNPSMYAFQAQHISLIYQPDVIECLQQYDKDFQTAWDRHDSSLYTEWTAHNIFAPFDRSAQNIDFDNNEDHFTLWDYCKKAFNRGIKKLSNLI